LRRTGMVFLGTEVPVWFIPVQGSVGMASRLIPSHFKHWFYLVIIFQIQRRVFTSCNAIKDDIAPLALYHLWRNYSLSVCELNEYHVILHRHYCMSHMGKNGLLRGLVGWALGLPGVSFSGWWGHTNWVTRWVTWFEWSHTPGYRHVGITLKYNLWCYVFYVRLQNCGKINTE